MAQSVFSLMGMPPAEAVRAVSWESIEWLFAPRSPAELLLRVDFDGVQAQTNRFLHGLGVDPIPERLEREPYLSWGRSVRKEEFYRAMCAIRAGA